jgi:flagellar M-ring protein FliF
MLDRMGHARSALVVGVGVLALLSIFAISRWATAPALVPLLPGMAIEGVAEVTAKLDEHSVPYELGKGGGEILIAENDLARARVLLARDGLPTRGRPGFELFDQPSWGMTDFTQLRGVEAAQVHLAISQSTAFRRPENPEAASVVLKLSSGARPSAELVEGISSLIASSVDGLDSDKVSVLDNTGRLLSAAVEPGEIGGLSKRQLGMRQEVESYLESKAEELVAQVVGAGNARVRVAADLNFDKIDRTVQTVDPEQIVALQEERSEIVPGEGQAGAGTMAEKSTFEASRTLEQFSGAAGSIKRLTVAVLVNARVGEEGSATALSADELTRVESLVRNAVGLDVTRGDDIAVVSIPFDAVTVMPENVPVGPGILQVIPQYQRPVVTIVALLLAFILGLKTLRAVRPQQVADAGSQSLPRSAGGTKELPRTVEAALSSAPQPAIVDNAHAQLLARSAQTPDMAARAIRAWMKES